MAKLSIEDKKEIIRLYNEEHIGCESIAKKFNIQPSNAKTIVHRYKIHGEIFLNKTYKNVPKNIKLEIINKVSQGFSKTSLSYEYLVSINQINKWLKQYEELGYDGLVDKPKGRPPTVKKETLKQVIDPNDKDAIIKQLQEKNLELEAEVEALKKLRALVQQRKAQQTKKKQ